MENTDKLHVTVYTESSPNPNSMKFVANFMLLPDGMNVDFDSPLAAAKSPLAIDLFRYNFVKRVFISSNFVTITKIDEADWTDVIHLLKPFIKAYLEEKNPVLLEFKEDIFDENDSDIVKKIKSLLDEYVRPAVESDGGAISFGSYENGKVTVKMQGSCSGCPSSTLTLKAGIENLMTRMIPEVTEVVAESV